MRAARAYPTSRAISPTPARNNPRAPPHSPSSRADRAVTGAPAPSIVHSHARVPRDAGPPPRPLDTPPTPSPPRAFRLGPLHQGRSGYTLPARPEVRFHVETGGRISSQAVRIDGGRLAFGS